MAAAAAASEQVQQAVQAAPPAAKKATAKAAVEVTSLHSDAYAAGSVEPLASADLCDGPVQNHPAQLTDQIADAQAVLDAAANPPPKKKTKTKKKTVAP